jgi:hypothetical protein
MKLFIVYIGGEMEQSHIELHDVRFCVGETIEDCYESLRNQWWGTPSSLHLDCWGELKYADGYNVKLVKNVSGNTENKLYFVNLGGYTKKEFTELHSNIFVVAPTDSKAKVKALKTIQHWDSPHRDYQYEVEKTVCLNDSIESYGYGILLEKTDIEQEFEFSCRYTPIGNHK